MKSKYLKKKTVKKLKWGKRDTLIAAIDEILDLYKDDKFNNGYASALQDMNVRSQLLADYIIKDAAERIVKTDKKILVDKDRLPKLIEDYFTEALKQE